ncbi:MAG: tRNA (N6-threonylcarbamoyladenosine(37)-N6)-methyltransferase TrmO [Lachnospiraceae bacterium]|nr:tRNA (N6-threonylcarbamoyladenosine(37)-N6)-methyltransferase TrmO [Lachnospiraceae bacterium]MBQ6197522.1 tRNA (N6-threonylcarbamoyladenosine(37)-N6)-methyltransferase TrmO [Lachnospiraceae bacterium]
MEIIAHIRNGYDEKFGVPRQAGLAEHTISRIVMEPSFRIREAFRGIEACSHIWLIWGFSENEQRGWTPTVRPPQLGGNERLGVFATRSPYRPNGLGISAVKLEAVDLDDPEGAYLTVSGADLMNDTPIYDIKPYVALADAIPDAADVLNGRRVKKKLKVLCSETLLSSFSETERLGLIETLEHDPRPAYQNDPDRIYGLAFAGRNIRFRVEGAVLSVLAVEKAAAVRERKL